MILGARSSKAVHYFEFLISQFCRKGITSLQSWKLEGRKMCTVWLQMRGLPPLTAGKTSLFPASPLCQPAIFASFNFFKFRQDSSEQPDRKIEIHFLKRTKPMRHKRKEPLVADSTCSTLVPLPPSLLTPEKSVSATFTINTVFSNRNHKCHTGRGRFTKNRIKQMKKCQSPYPFTLHTYLQV